MNYEKKYKALLEQAKEELKTCGSLDCDAAKQIFRFFPELAESEDEMARKEILDYCHKRMNNEFLPITINQVERWIAWLEKQGESKEKPTKEQVWDYCNKISHEWWQITMDKWETLTDEEKDKYNQFIGFNDFSDMLMNITAGALFQLRDTGKLEYEEGSLLLEKPDDTPKPLEVTNAINEKQGEQKPAWNDADEERFVSCLQRLGTGNIEQPDTINTMWLKSIKNRVQTIAKFVGEEQYMKGVRDGVNDVIKRPEDYGLLPSPF